MFFQCTPRLLFQSDVDQQRIEVYVEQVQNIVRPLDPVLIYSRQSDVPEAINRICSLRGPEWRAFLIRALTETLYAQRRTLTGIEGAIAFLAAYQQLCDDLFDRLAIERIAFSDPGKDWETFYQELVAFLGLQETRLRPSASGQADKEAVWGIGLSQGWIWPSCSTGKLSGRSWTTVFPVSCIRLH
jgi:hypothetical protein